MARRQLAGQHGQTLDATALVHEAYLKLIGRREAQFDDRAHFFAYAASAMRSVVVDYARQRLAQKRGGDLHRVTELPEDIEGGLRLDEDMLGLDTALTQLAAVDERLARWSSCAISPACPNSRSPPCSSAPNAASAATGRRRRLFLLARDAGLEGTWPGRAPWTPNAGNGCPRCSMPCSSSMPKRASAAWPRCARRIRRLADDLAGLLALEEERDDFLSRTADRAAARRAPGRDHRSRTSSTACSAKAAWARSGWPAAPTACTSAASR